MTDIAETKRACKRFKGLSSRKRQWRDHRKPVPPTNRFAVDQLSANLPKVKVLGGNLDQPNFNAQICRLLHFKMPFGVLLQNGTGPEPFFKYSPAESFSKTIIDQVSFFPRGMVGVPHETLLFISMEKPPIGGFFPRERKKCSAAEHFFGEATP
jgi:hypothetical protein